MTLRNILRIRRATQLVIVAMPIAAATASPIAVVPPFVVANGDFDRDPVQSNDVIGWFNSKGSAWYWGAWQGPQSSPNGTSVLGLSGAPEAGAWAYQPISLRTPGLQQGELKFEVGAMTDMPGFRNIGVTVQLFQAGSAFTGADNVDILGAPGVQLIDQKSITTGLQNYREMLQTSVTLNLTSANATDQLYLRFSSFNGETGSGPQWALIDNVSISSFLLYYVGSASGGTWDKETTAHFKAMNPDIGTTTFHNTDSVVFSDYSAVDANNVSTINVVGTVKPNEFGVYGSHDFVFEGGSIQGSPTVPLRMEGTGKVTFRNKNTFGPIEIVRGTIELADTPGPGHGITSLYGHSISNNGTIILNRTFSPPASPDEVFLPLQLEQSISGSGKIVVKTHASIGQAGLTANNNSFTGSVTIEGGFTVLADVNGLGSAANGTRVFAGATLGVTDEWQLGANAVISEPLMLNGLGVATFFNDGLLSGALFQQEGKRTFSGPIKLESTTAVVVRDDPATPADSVMTWTGTLTAAPGAGLQKKGAGTLVYNGATFDSLSVDAGTLVQRGKTRTRSLHLEPGVKLDLTGSSLVIDYDGSASTYADLLLRVADGTIVTSLDSVRHIVGIVDNALNATPITSIDGTPIDPSSVILRGTLRGDFDLDGGVSFDDLLTLARNYSGIGKTYQQGDGDYSGTVDFDDLLALARNYNQSLSPTQAASLSSDFVADFALAQAQVPEPIALSLVGVVALGRRRRVCK